MFKNILVPVTSSRLCEQAADAAIAFARRFESNLVLMTVHGFEHTWGEAELLERPEELKRIEEGMDKHFARKIEGVARHKVVVAQGVPHVEILRMARDSSADLILMCPYRKELPQTKDLLWTRVGHTLERVIQNAHCPVMMVNRPVPADGHVFRHVLAATGLSGKDSFCVEYAAQLARKCGAKLTVFSVLDADAGAANLPQEEIGRIAGERMIRMNVEYGDMVKDVKDVEYVCYEGQTAVEILKLARLRGADVIVMAHHTREADLDCAFERSTVVHVAFRALCPVVSINRKFQMPAG